MSNQMFIFDHKSYTMKDFFKDFEPCDWIFLIGLILVACIFFSPIPISIMTGDYWYMFLFLVTWIPALVLAKITAVIHDVCSK